ncbi:MAG: glycerol-3-phosphate 1-O-acyltransferase PlsY [Candidatus Margulisiibacteriota bacterium]|nr:glycerol-3-phosphate 1-O-acyltransferase PlsY [Candidatus Margulisiibacteriota bacterium]
MIQAPAVFGLLLTLAYLIGAIPFSAIIATFKGVDLRRVGSGNYGATNVYRALGLNYALFVFMLDALKGTAVVYLTMSMFTSPVLHVLIGFTAIFGHTFSLFLGFKGGKGVATAAGVFAILAPKPFLITFLVVISVIYLTKIVSVGTLIGCVLLPILMIVFNTSSVIFYSILPISFFIVIKHRSNIVRLIKGTENKLK